MAIITAKFKCGVGGNDGEGCGHLNTIRLDRTQIRDRNTVVVFCCNCGLVHNSNGDVEEKIDGNWLPCLPFEGPSKDAPNGFTKDVKETKWIDANGKEMTRVEFAEMHGIDPWTAFCSVPQNSKKDVCNNFPTRCKNEGDVLKVIFHEAQDDTTFI